MNQRQKKFADLYLQGMSGAEAYEKAGYSCVGTTASKAAHRLLNKVELKEYISTMNEKTDSSTIKTVTERKEMLSRIMDREEGESPSDAIRASAELSKMDGAYEPQKQEVNTRIIIGGDAE